MIPVAIIGVSGYGGGELARILARHPEVKLTCATSETYAGKRLKHAFPSFAGTEAGELLCQVGVENNLVEAAEVVFLAQEVGVAMQLAGKLLSQGKKTIDLSADFRLKDVRVFQQWYKKPHTAPDLLTGTAVYGLPELHKAAIQKAVLVANPGCHVTASLLALAPLLAGKKIRTSGIVIDSKTGISGAGRAKNDLIYKYAEANDTAKPYQVGGLHRHIPEIEQELSWVAGEPVTVTFTPHLVPMTRGILATAYALLTDTTANTEDLTDLYADFYADAPFVVVRDPYDHPTTKDTLGSNFCHLSVTTDPRTGLVIVNSVIDNLVKGAAGQAVQNMNLMYGFPETVGLEGGGLWP